MREATAENLKITLAALATIVLVFGFVFVLDSRNMDWQKWLPLGTWTAGIFGFLAYGYRPGLRRPRALCVFLATLTAHLVVLILYLRSVASFPNLFFLFFGPLEAAVIGFLISLLADFDYRPGRPACPRRESRSAPGGRREAGTTKKYDGPE